MADKQRLLFKSWVYLTQFGMIVLLFFWLFFSTSNFGLILRDNFLVTLISKITSFLN